LDSVYAQEGVGELFEMEVIVVDDGSADATSEVIRRYPGVKYIRLETNRGQYAATNVGIKASTGKYIAFLDDDDLYLPTRLKAHVPVLETQSQVGLVYGQVIHTGEGPDVLWPDADRAPSGNAFPTFLGEELIIPCHVMVRREAFEKAGYFDENLRTMGHYDMFLRLSFYVPFAFIPGPVAIGRFSEQGKWFTNVKGGLYEQVVPFILERALTLLPDNAERAELRCKTLTSWFSEITYWLEKADKADRMRSYVLTTLKKEPWMLTKPEERDTVLQGLSRVACALALASDSPTAAVMDFCTEAAATTNGDGFREWFSTRRLLAQVWVAVGYMLAKTGSPQHRRAASHAALHAVLHNPAQLRRKVVLKLLAGPVVG
jgi:glycosyltransferase involved in cell wall biosynthesis